jgi:hypothetical protein
MEVKVTNILLARNFSYLKNILFHHDQQLLYNFKFLLFDLYNHYEFSLRLFSYIICLL